MKNVILIGMPGSGKSTVGVVLAKKLGYRFIDSDLVIQEKYGKLLYQLIEERGEAGFLMLENEINASITAEGAVIATGGSAVYGKEAMRHFREIGQIVYLKLPFEELEQLTLGALRKAVVEGDAVNGTLMAGQIAGLVKEEQSCREMVEEIMEQAEALLGHNRREV